jgi:hypothetical protein
LDINMKQILFSMLGLGLAMVSGIAAADSPITRVRGTIEQATDQSFQLKTRDGKSITVKLTGDTRVVGVTHAEMSDIKPDSYVGSAAVPQPDGTLKALEVSVLDPAMRGAGDGQVDYDLTPTSKMTNGAVGDLAGTDGRTMTLKYKGGEKKLIVPPDVPIIALAPGDHSLLQTGVHAVVYAPKSDDGVLFAAVVLAGKNGVVPPL